jgi:cation diffusion facilitator CzcD-associated flavoprotein CzcO
MTQQQNTSNLIVIGAGIYGIQAARTYLELHPTHNIVILEADSKPGGVWSADRTYDAFWTQSPVGIWEFSDQPLEGVELKDQYHQYFRAWHFTRYLNQYLDNHVYEGKSLRDRLVLNARIEKLWKHEGQWHAQTVSGDQYAAPKVIDATGLTSVPNIPEIPGADTFQGTLIHHKEFGQSDILRICKRVTVVGGAKSAADLAYACAKADKEVHWVIRKSGNGPANYLPADAPISYYGNSNSAFHTRFMNAIVTSILAPATWGTWFLHQTTVGRAIFRFIWSNLNKDLMTRANYDREDGRENGFANLKPDTELFWQNDSSGVNQRPDFFDTIARNVKVYRENIDRISNQDVHLSDGTSIETDAIIYATGWQESTPYLDPDTAYSLGLASPSSGIDDITEEKWRILEEAADSAILQQFPILANPAPYYKRERNESPFRLYNSILPIKDHSIAFLGKMHVANNTYNSEVQSLFAIAVMDGTLPLPSDAEMEKDVAHVRAWQKRRYPAKGVAGNWFWFDVVPYVDTVLTRLGLESHRTPGIKGLFKPMEAKDFQGLIDEYKTKFGQS